MMYIMLQGTVYGIDLKSNESLVVAQGLTEGSYAVSGDASRFAWQEGQNLYESEKVHVMDFNTSQKQEIVGEVNDDKEQDTVQEKFFLHASESYDMVKADIDKLLEMI